MRTLIHRIYLIVGAGLILCGCAATQDVQILDGEIYKLQSQVNQMQKEREGIKKDLGTQKRDLTAETQKMTADMKLRMENLESEFRIVQTGMEEYKDLSKRPSKEIDRVKEDMQVRLRMVEERGKTLDERNKAQIEKMRDLEEKNRAQADRLRQLDEQLKGLQGVEERLKALQVVEERLKGLEAKVNGPSTRQPEPEKQAESKATESKTMMGSGDLYKEAYDTFHRGDLDLSRKKFESFLKQYPNTELSDNAQFWIGEIYFQKKDFERAILEYEKTISKYPEGDKVPAALFKQGMAFLELGDKTNGRNLLKRVIERFPYSDQAEFAKKKIETTK